MQPPSLQTMVACQALASHAPLPSQEEETAEPRCARAGQGRAARKRTLWPSPCCCRGLPLCRIHGMASKSRASETRVALRSQGASAFESFRVGESVVGGQVRIRRKRQGGKRKRSSTRCCFLAPSNSSGLPAFARTSHWIAIEVRVTPLVCALGASILRGTFFGACEREQQHGVILVRKMDLSQLDNHNMW